MPPGALSPYKVLSPSNCVVPRYGSQIFIISWFIYCQKVFRVVVFFKRACVWLIFFTFIHFHQKWNSINLMEKILPYMEKNKMCMWKITGYTSDLLNLEFLSPLIYYILADEITVGELFGGGNLISMIFDGKNQTQWEN